MAAVISFVISALRLTVYISLLFMDCIGGLKPDEGAFKPLS